MIRKQQSHLILFTAVWLTALIAMPSVRGDCPAAPPLPNIPAHLFSVLDFGAVGDGKTIDTQAIAKAIIAANAGGGGKVIVPSGTFLTGPVRLLSNVELNLAQGATLLFSRNPDDYPLIVTRYEGIAQVRCQSPVFADSAHDIAITGSGVIDGSGDAWRLVRRRAVPADVWQQLVRSGGVVVGGGSSTRPDDGDSNGEASPPAQSAETWYPSKLVLDSAGALRELHRGPDALNPNAYARYRIALRPTMVELVNCSRILLDGPTFRNSASWNLHPLYSNQITVRHVTIFNQSWAANGDGIDIDSCRDVLMTDCTVDAGDDGICLKSGRDAEGRSVNRPTENVVITRCRVDHAHGGFVIGSEMSGGVRNAWCSDCTFVGTDVGLRFKTTRGRGGVVQDIHVDKITMKDIKQQAILFDTYYMIKGAKGATRKAAPVDAGTPSFKDFSVNHVSCDGCGQAIYLSGLPELPLSDVTLTNVTIDHARTGITLEDCNKIALRHVTVRVAGGQPLDQRENVQNLVLDDVNATRE
jgi:polygalacturonase